MSKSAKESAYDYLKEKILSGHLASGTALKPDQIAQEIGISRMPVREAIQRLNAEGLIEFGANRRPVVRVYGPAEITELFEIRVALECLAIARSASSLTEDDFIQLESILVKMDEASADRPLWLHHHSEFHMVIYRAAGMPRLLEEIKRAQNSIKPFILMYIDLYHVPEMPGSEHRVMIDVLRKKEATEATMFLAEHIRRTASDLIYFILNGRQSSAETISRIYTAHIPKKGK